MRTANLSNVHELRLDYMFVSYIFPAKLLTNSSNKHMWIPHRCSCRPCLVSFSILWFFFVCEVTLLSVVGTSHSAQPTGRRTPRGEDATLRTTRWWLLRGRWCCEWSPALSERCKLISLLKVSCMNMSILFWLHINFWRWCLGGIHHYYSPNCRSPL